jgi:hypothetical protein
MSQPLTRTSQSYILSIRDPLDELYRRTWLKPEEVWSDPDHRHMLRRVVENAWYACLHRDMATSALMNLACRFRDQDHPMAAGIMSFGQLLQRELELFGFYDANVYLNTYHLVGLHGQHAIRIKRAFYDQLKLTCL